MKAVVALGGNALTGKDRQTDIKRQFESTRCMAKSVAKMITNGWYIVLTHGNGPQVGTLLLQQKTITKSKSQMPLHVLVALTQGQIGYILQQALYNEFSKKNIWRNVSTVITQTLVDEQDEAFSNPTKPIGPIYNNRDARILKKQYIMGMVEDGWRIIVPSPAPLSIIEASIIKTLMEQKVIVIAAGGGGIPVIRKGGVLCGVNAVVDKDLASQRLANEISADILLILTDVDHVFVNFGSEKQEALKEVSAKELAACYGNGEFQVGSMGPKVQAALQFLKNGGNEAIITSIDLAWDALEHGVGTHVHP